MRNAERCSCVPSRHTIATGSFNASSSSARVSTSTICVPIMRIAWSYAKRWFFGMITRFAMPSVNGSFSIFTGSFPATQAAVPSATAAALPQVTMPHSAPVNSAIRAEAASINSSRLTNIRDAAATASRTSGSMRLPPCTVRTEQQLMNGRTPRLA